ncbi:uncharacterized protein LOC117654439 [Thrips palmi]|uniref:Uncharacterized protein LOC117654439 n=1 Tax=Thrips palmi TaxID=161013 RepID=A0A6P9AF46_THRPL|nr:uncharacterized protein LOC117654439 [Thrips palmi]XP_034256961.1 uncharacterized protein LOC117654439 [Thrips palmi]XP_034256962.1 uncharacterized protein LOC117654439 [Thrips palmi]
MPASVIGVAEADVEMVSLDSRAERQRQMIRHAQELHHLNLAAARQGLRERTAQADTAKVRCEIARVEAEAVRLKLELAREALREARAKADLAELQLAARKRELLSEAGCDLMIMATEDEIKMIEERERVRSTGQAEASVTVPIISENMVA